MHGIMKSRIMKSLGFIATAGAVWMVAGGAVSAQSTDDIIKGLQGPNSGATRGIKFGGSGAASAPSPAPRPVSASPAPVHRQTSNAPAHAAPAHGVAHAQPAISGPSVNLTVNFPTGSAVLTPGARASLHALGRALMSKDLASFRFRIEGHTDSVGSKDENLRLSQARAEAVVAYLSSQYNVQPARLQAAGMGQEQPFVATPPQTPEPRNRRVQVINIGA